MLLLVCHVDLIQLLTYLSRHRVRWVGLVMTKICLCGDSGCYWCIKSRVWIEYRRVPIKSRVWIEYRRDHSCCYSDRETNDGVNTQSSFRRLNDVQLSKSNAILRLPRLF